jgi:hypothetical protein
VTGPENGAGARGGAPTTTSLSTGHRNSTGSSEGGRGQRRSGGSNRPCNGQKPPSSSSNGEPPDGSSGEPPDGPRSERITAIRAAISRIESERGWRLSANEQRILCDEHGLDLDTYLTAVGKPPPPWPPSVANGWKHPSLYLKIEAPTPLMMRLLNELDDAVLIETDSPEGLAAVRRDQNCVPQRFRKWAERGSEEGQPLLPDPFARMQAFAVEAISSGVAIDDTLATLMNPDHQNLNEFWLVTDWSCSPVALRLTLYAIAKLGQSVDADRLLESARWCCTPGGIDDCERTFNPLERVVTRARRRPKEVVSSVLGDRRLVDALAGLAARERGQMICDLRAAGIPAREVRLLEAAITEAATENKQKMRGPRDGANDERLLRVFTPAEAIESMNGRHFLVHNLGGRVRIATLDEGEEIVYQTPEDFRLRHSNSHVRVEGTDRGSPLIPLGKFWLADPRRRDYASIGCYPPIANRPHEPPPRAYNTWSGFAIEPRAGDWSRTREHIRAILANGDADLDEYVLRWVAWTVQNPGCRAEAALVLRGDEGVGKGLFGNTLRAFFGRHAVHVIDPDHFITGRFNAHMHACVLFFADECFWPGDRRSAGKLKGLITEDTIRVEPKGVDSFEVPNLLHVVISSNDDWVVPAGRNARRFVVANVSDARRGDSRYFGELVRELENGGRQAMLHDLLALDLGTWHPRQIVRTAALADQMELSLLPAEEWLLSLLDAGRLPGNAGYGPKGIPDDIAYSDDLLAHARESVPALRHRALRFLVAAMKGIGCNPWQDPVTRKRGWQFCSLVEARANWVKTHWSREWPPGDEWRRR